MSDVFEHLDDVVARLATVRDALLADPYAANRAAQLAVVFEFEARAWSQFYELSSLQLVWRAALAAEAGARAQATLWAQRAGQPAEREEWTGVEPGEGWAAGHVVRQWPTVPTRDGE